MTSFLFYCPEDAIEKKNMCLSPIIINYSENYKKYRGVLIHRYNHKQVVNCSKCIECKSLKIEEWQIRWYEELKTSLPNSSYFITLTYNDKNIPKKITPDGEEITTLQYQDFQKFMKRLRKRQDKLHKINNLDKVSIKYHCCGEYGKRYTKRPHYHLLITNLTVPLDEIEQIWGNGLVHIGEDVNHLTIKYVLKYSLKSNYINQKTEKIYQEIVKTIKIKSFPEEETKHKFYNTKNINYVFPTTEETIIIRKKISEIYSINCQNEYRETERSICSKGIWESIYNC